MRIMQHQHDLKAQKQAQRASTAELQRFLYMHVVNVAMHTDRLLQTKKYNDTAYKPPLLHFSASCTCRPSVWAT